MENLKAGDLLISSCYVNVWDNPGDTSCSTIIDYIEEKQAIIVIDIYKRKYYENEVTELKVLTPGGNVGWVAAERLNESWAIL